MLRSFRRFIESFLFALMSLFITMLIIFGALYAYMETSLPDVTVLNDVHMQVPLRIYSSDGKLMAEYGAKRRNPIHIDQVPKQLLQAIIATEDARFYSHPGVDLIGLIRAAIAVISSGHKTQGASTITMQVARNFFLTPKKTYSRKIKEILLAIKIDKTLSKQKILELYINKVYFGNRAYGVAAAASVYYGKSLNELTLPQMAMIAGLPQAPSRNNPIGNPVNALARRNHVLERMYRVGDIDKQTYEDAIKAPLTAKYHGEAVNFHAPYIAEMTRQAVVKMYGVRAYDSDLKVYTTISSTLQNEATVAIQNGLLDYSNRHGYQKTKINLGLPSENNREMWLAWLADQPTFDNIQMALVVSDTPDSLTALIADGSTITIPWTGLSWARPALADGYVGPRPTSTTQIASPGDAIYVTYLSDKQHWQLTQAPKAQAAMVVLNPKTGAILALQGGFDFDLSSFNRALQARRQPGSSFKPFIFSAALAKGFTLASTINDAPLVIRDTGENKWWRPENDTLEFYGPTRLRVALAESRNLVSIRLLRDIGLPYTLNYLQRFGFDEKKLPHALSLALGTADLTPMQMATGYTVFANGGYQVTPFFIEKIVQHNHDVLFTANTTPGPQVITPQNAYLMTQAMKEVIKSGTGRAALALKRADLAGKTGTTNDQVDAWFSGFNSHLLATVWVGFDDHEESLHEFGAQAALPIWMAFMKAALVNQPIATMAMPPNIIVEKINPRTGEPAYRGERNAISELFDAQNLPTSMTESTDEDNIDAKSHAEEENDAAPNAEEAIF